MNFSLKVLDSCPQQPRVSYKKVKETYFGLSALLLILFIKRREALGFPDRANHSQEREMEILINNKQ